MKLTTIIQFFLFLFIDHLNAQDIAVWNGKKCAISLTYDDGLNVHLDNVIPSLDSLGFKGTFYVPGKSESLQNRIQEWKNISENGHELGNHTLFHPCKSKKGKRKWVESEYDLDNYTLSQLINEIKVANTLLKAFDGKSERTLAYTCGDTAIGNKSFVKDIQSEFIGARGVNTGTNKILDLDIFNVRVFVINGQSEKELIKIIKQAKSENSWAVFLFHGVGGEHSYNVSKEAHKGLLSYLKSHEEEVWVVPFIEVIKRINEHDKIRLKKK